MMNVLSHPGHSNSKCYIIGNWTCFSDVLMCWTYSVICFMTCKLTIYQRWSCRGIFLKLGSICCWELILICLCRKNIWRSRSKNLVQLTKPFHFLQFAVWGLQALGINIQTTGKQLIQIDLHMQYIHTVCRDTDKTHLHTRMVILMKQVHKAKA